jgi:hypothetical protein
MYKVNIFIYNQLCILLSYVMKYTLVMQLPRQWWTPVQDLPNSCKRGNRRVWIRSCNSFVDRAHFEHIWSLEFSPNFGTLQINKSRLLCIFNAARSAWMHVADYGGPSILPRISSALKKTTNKKIMCKDATTHYLTRTWKMNACWCYPIATSMFTVSAYSKPKSYCRASGSPVPPCMVLSMTDNLPNPWSLDGTGDLLAALCSAL